jgi:hypothetical protein
VSEPADLLARLPVDLVPVAQLSSQQRHCVFGLGLQPKRCPRAGGADV